MDRFPFEMNGIFTKEHLNVLPLGSCDSLIGIDWIEIHRVKLDSYNNTFEWINEEGNPRTIKGVLTVASIR